MPYKVLIVVKNEWWSDQKAFKSFKDAQRHRKDVAERWNDCETAIKAPDDRVLAFHESRQYQASLARLKAENIA